MVGHERLASPERFPGDNVQLCGEVRVMRVLYSRCRQQLVNAPLELFAPPRMRIRYVAPDQPVPPEDEIGLAAAFSPHRWKERQAVFPVVEFPGRPCSRIEVHADDLAAAVGASYRQRS